MATNTSGCIVTNALVRCTALRAIAANTFIHASSSFRRGCAYRKRRKKSGSLSTTLCPCSIGSGAEGRRDPLRRGGLDKRGSAKGSRAPTVQEFRRLPIHYLMITLLYAIKHEVRSRHCCQVSLATPLAKCPSQIAGSCPTCCRQD